MKELEQLKKEEKRLYNILIDKYSSKNFKNWEKVFIKRAGYELALKKMQRL